MKRIRLKHSTLVARVSNEDYDGLSLFQWHLETTTEGLRYAKARLGINNWVYMHNIIKKPSAGQETIHRDKDGLNNMRLNLKRVPQNTL